MLTHAVGELLLGRRSVDHHPAPRARVMRRGRGARGLDEAVEHVARHRFVDERPDRPSRLQERRHPTHPAHPSSNEVASPDRDIGR